MANRTFAVLMTACIAPESGISVKPGNRLQRADPHLRLQDYASALRFWLDHPDPRIGAIVFADNSGYDLSELRALAAGSGSPRRVEFLSLPLCQWPEHIHYGYCELQIVDHALAQSEVLAEAPCFIKATGRLRFSGLSRLLDRLGRDFLFAVDCHRLPFRDKGGASTQLMLFDSAFYRERLVGANGRMKPWAISHIEDLMFQELMPLRGQKGAMLRWPVNVDCIGFSASRNVSYTDGKMRIRRAVRSALRRFVPGLWI